MRIVLAADNLLIYACTEIPLKPLGRGHSLMPTLRRSTVFTLDVFNVDTSTVLVEKARCFEIKILIDEEIAEPPKKKPVSLQQNEHFGN